MVTVVGLGLRSPPTAETPEEADETKLQRVDGDIPKKGKPETELEMGFFLEDGDVGKAEFVS